MSFLLVKIETRVLLSLAIAWLLAEVAMRPLEPLLSADLRHIRSFESFAQQLESARSEGRPGVVVVGNSLARAGIDRETLVEVLNDQKLPRAKVVYLAPDASGVNEWTAAWRRYLTVAKVRPDLVLLVTGPQHLLDQPVRSPEKLAAFHARLVDWPEILRDWLGTGNERGRFLLAGISRVFANRDRLRPLLFYQRVPGYAAAVEAIRSGPNRETVARFEAGTGTERCRELFQDLVAGSGRVDLLAVPLPEPYSLPPEILRVAAENGVRVFGEAAAVRWSEDAFPDGYHLGGRAAERFTLAWGKTFPLSEAW